MGVQISAVAPGITEKSTSSPMPAIIPPMDASSLVSTAPAQSSSEVAFDDRQWQVPMPAPMNVPVTMSVPRAAASAVPYQRLGPAGRPRGGCGWFCRNQSALLIGAGVVLLGGAAVWMLAKSARGFNRGAAVAGLGGIKKLGPKRKWTASMLQKRRRKLAKDRAEGDYLNTLLKKLAERARR